jgi:hypothetical protein
MLLQAISEYYQKRSVVFCNYRRTAAPLGPSALIFVGDGKLYLVNVQDGAK